MMKCFCWSCVHQQSVQAVYVSKIYIWTTGTSVCQSCLHYCTADMYTTGVGVYIVSSVSSIISWFSCATQVKYTSCFRIILVYASVLFTGEVPAETDTVHRMDLFDIEEVPDHPCELTHPNKVLWRYSCPSSWVEHEACRALWILLIVTSQFCIHSQGTLHLSWWCPVNLYQNVCQYFNAKNNFFSRTQSDRKFWMSDQCIGLVVLTDHDSNDSCQSYQQIVAFSRRVGPPHSLHGVYRCALQPSRGFIASSAFFPQSCHSEWILASLNISVIMTIFHVQPIPFSIQSHLLGMFCSGRCICGWTKVMRIWGDQTVYVDLL